MIYWTLSLNPISDIADNRLIFFFLPIIEWYLNNDQNNFIKVLSLIYKKITYLSNYEMGGVKQKIMKSKIVLIEWNRRKMNGKWYSFIYLLLLL